MADISTYTKKGSTTDSTVQAIYQGIKQGHNERPRRYLGASIIGKPCARQLWMDFRWVKFPNFDGRMLRLFETGHLEEFRFVKNMQDAGIEVHEVDDRTGEQFAISMLGGHFRGHADGVALGIVDAPKTWHLCEFKTHNEKSFNKLVKEGVEVSKPEHYSQMQVYMKGLGLTRAYYLARNKNTDELYGERIHYNPDHAQRMIDRAERIIFANEPPSKISDRPDWYQCKFCDYGDYCHKTAKPTPNIDPNINCRTCLHSTPVKENAHDSDEPLWICERYQVAIPYEQQLLGCTDHRWLPMLFPNLEYQSYDKLDMGDGVCAELIHYKESNGEDWVNNGRGSIIPTVTIF